MQGEVSVIGCSGYVGSNVAIQLVKSGYKVRGTVRKLTAENETRLQNFISPHAMNGGELELVEADPTNIDSIISVMQGCSGAINSAGTTERVPETVDIMKTIAANVCDAALAAGVPAVVFTSSTGSTNPPEGEPALKNEIDHWSDADLQLEQKKYPAAAKTLYDRTILSRMEASNGKLRCATLHPSMIMGPNPNINPDGSTKLLAGLIAGKVIDGPPPNSSMSLIHVEDLARLHVAALQNPDAKGRYFAVKQSWHWRDILQELERQVDAFTAPTYAEDVELVTPTQFDFSRRDSLGVELRDLAEIIASGVDQLRRHNLLK